MTVSVQRGLALLKGRKARALAVTAAALVASSAHAAAGDLDLAPINAAIATITQVGTLVFAVVVGIKTWKWIRQAL